MSTAQHHPEPDPDEQTHEQTLEQLPHIDDRPPYPEDGWYGAFVTDRDCPHCDVGVVVRTNSPSTPDPISSRSCSAECGYADSDMPT